MPFTLRSADDTENPIAPRLYGKGITAGRVAYYRPNASGARTAFILILAEGARRNGDTGCEGIERFIYAGFELPEFDATGARNWQFHPGAMTALEVRKTVSVNASTDTFTSPAHGYVDDTPIAFAKYGTTPGLPTGVFAHTKYYIKNATANTFQIAYTPGGAIVDITSNGNGLDFYVYQANAGLFDPVQGKPTLIPDLLFTFSGIAYVEVLLPEDLSDGNNEPDRSKVVMKGKRLVTYGWTGTELEPLTVEYSVNNAWVLTDMLINDGNIALNRFSSSLSDYATRCAELIDWTGGNSLPAFIEFPTLINVARDVSTRSLTKTTGGVSWNGYAATAVLATGLRDFSIDGRIMSGGWRLGFYTAATGGWSFAVEFDSNTITQIENNGTRTLLGYYGDTSRIKVAVENTVVKAYLDGAPLSLVGTFLLSGGPYYIRLECRFNNARLEDILVMPGGDNSTPQRVSRYTAHLAFISPTSLPEAMQGVFDRSPGCDWQDVGGQFQILTDVNRSPVHTFFCDPNSTLQRSNIVKDGFTITRKPPDTRPNYYRYSYRDDAEAYLLRKYGSVDRPQLRDALGGLLVDAGLIHFGVMSASLAERIMETKARLQSDLDIQYEIVAFIDSLHVAKGDFVTIVDPIAGYTEGAPAIGVVVEESFNFPLNGIDTRRFLVNVIADDWYSDTYHGTVRPLVPPPINPGFFTAPPVLDNLNLSTSVYVLPDGTRHLALQGLATFRPAVGQRGRIWWKPLGLGQTLTANPTTNVLTIAAHGLSNGARVEVATLDGILPGGLSADVAYYVVNATTNTLQLSLVNGGAAVDLTDAGSGVSQLFLATAYQQIEGLLYPAPDTQQAGFEVRSVIAGWHVFKIVTEQSASGISQPFSLHPRWYQEITFAPSQFMMLDIPVWRVPEMSGAPGVYVPVGPDGSEVWLGATIERDTGTGFELIAQVEQAATFGDTLTALGPPASIYGRDDVNTVTVQRFTGAELRNYTPAEISNGGGLVLIGDEILAYEQATPVSGQPTQYVLSRLYRGLHGTEGRVSTHTNTERFCVLDDNVPLVPLSEVFIGTPIIWRVTSFGRSAGNTISFTWTCNHWRPLAPVISAFPRNASDALFVGNTQSSDYAPAWTFLAEPRQRLGLLGQLEAEAATIFELVDGSGNVLERQVLPVAVPITPARRVLYLADDAEMIDGYRTEEGLLPATELSGSVVIPYGVDYPAQHFGVWNSVTNAPVAWFAVYGWSLSTATFTPIVTLAGNVVSIQEPPTDGEEIRQFYRLQIVGQNLLFWRGDSNLYTYPLPPGGLYYGWEKYNQLADLQIVQPRQIRWQKRYPNIGVLPTSHNLVVYQQIRLGNFMNLNGYTATRTFTR